MDGVYAVNADVYIVAPTSHGVYEGALRGLWSPGAWRVWAALKWPGRPYVSYAVGSVQAVR